MNHGLQHSLHTTALPGREAQDHGDGSWSGQDRTGLTASTKHLLCARRSSRHVACMNSFPQLVRCGGARTQTQAVPPSPPEQG